MSKGLHAESAAINNQTDQWGWLFLIWSSIGRDGIFIPADPVLSCLMWEENAYLDACDTLVFVHFLGRSRDLWGARGAQAHVAPTSSEYIGSEQVTMSQRDDRVRMAASERPRARDG